ncbi:unnamed protein product [Hymenolepis diminuta]|uniref:Uncharacterized protein n=1 Tax=Hymenolepis diminuta TaxID=6216 RepID=A0A564Y5V3_HYMDI|nr:unnamed protein product [Hymenolepis diminuta]
MTILMSIGTLTHNNQLFAIPLFVIGLCVLLSAIIGIILKVYNACHSVTPYGTAPVVVLTPNQEKDLKNSQASDSESLESAGFYQPLVR